MTSIIGGFDRQFEGFQVQGNLSVHPHGDINYGGNGSIEASGILFVDCIQSYSTNGTICLLENLNISNDFIISNSTLPSSNSTTGSLLLNGGLSINNSEDASSISSGGTITTNGGVSIGKQLFVGGEVHLEKNTYISGILGVDLINSINNNILIQNNISISETEFISNSNFPSYSSSTGSVVLYGGLSIDNPTNATGFTSGGALTVAGGTNIGQDLYVDGNTYLNDDLEISPGNLLIVDEIVSNGYNGGLDSDTLLLQNNISISETEFISNSNLPSYSSSTGSVVLYGGLSIDNPTNATGFTSGGALTVAGGTNIGQDLYVDGNTYLNDDLEISPGNLLIVDEIVSNGYSGGLGSDTLLLQNNISISETEFISNSTLPSYNSSTGSFVLYGGLSIDDQTNATDLTSGGAVTIAGGVSIAKDLHVGGITNIYDNTNFYNSLVTFDSGSSLIIQNTTDSSEFSGGALTVLGGMSIGQSFYVNGTTFLKDGLDTNKQRITNVALPIDGWDAVNKNYLLAQLQAFTPGDGDGGGECCNVNPTGPTVQLTFQLNENVLIPEDIPTFTFDNSIYRSFVSYVYLDAVSGSKNTLFTIKGVYTQNGWVVNTSFIGDHSGVDFYVRTTETHAIMQYTNKNTFGPSYILFNTPYFVRVDTTENVERTLTLTENKIQPDTTNVLYIGGSIVAAQGLAYVTVENKSAFFIINTILSEGQWKYHTTFIGDETNVRFYLDTSGEVGTLSYTNKNNTPANVIWRETRITATTQQIELQLDTITPIAVSQLQFGNLNERTKHYTISVEVPNTNKAAFYFIDAILDSGVWKINTRFMGTPIGVNFSCKTVNGIGTLYYTNTNTTQTILRYIVTTPQAYTPPGVGSGGTGVTSLLENAVLRGNGTQGILATSDFIYEDYTIKLSADSSIEIYNETEPINSTTGMSITTFGGASVGKDLYVKHVNITPSSGDLVKEQEYFAQNNIVSPQSIDGFKFDSTKVRAFHALVSVEIICDGVELYSCHDIHGINKESQWVINNRFIGDNTGVNFSIDYDNNYGQLKYTSADYPNWQQSKIKFRAVTTSK